MTASGLGRGQVHLFCSLSRRTVARPMAARPTRNSLLGVFDLPPFASIEEQARADLELSRQLANVIDRQ